MESADTIRRTQRRLSLEAIQAMIAEMPTVRARLDGIEAKLDDGTPTDAGRDSIAAGTSQGSPEAAVALRNLSLLSQEELISEATDPTKRMCALVKSELMAGLMAEQAALGGKYHWAKQFMEHQRRCGDTLQKLRREAALKSKSLPADWDNLRRWIIYDLKKLPEALELFYQRMDQYEEGRLPRFEPEREESEGDADNTSGDTA